MQEHGCQSSDHWHSFSCLLTINLHFWQVSYVWFAKPHFSHKVLTLCRRVIYKDVIAVPCVVDQSRIKTFSYTTSYTCISQLFCLVTFVSKLSAPWSRMLRFQVTNTQTLPDSTLLEPFNCNHTTTDLDVFTISCVTSSIRDHGFV